MNTKIEIIRVDEKNQKAAIIGLENNNVIVFNETLNITYNVDLEDLKQYVKFL